MELDIEILATREAFAAVREEWNDLARRSSVDHAFMRHEWFTAWVDHLPYEGTLSILTARRGGILVGAAPLRIMKVRRRGLTVSMLAFLQSGISPRCHFLVDRNEDPRPVFDAVCDIPGWDLAELKGLATDEPLTTQLLDHLRSRSGCVVEPGARSPYQAMPGSWEEFEKSRSRGFRKRFRNSWNRCETAESFELVTIETAADLDAAFPEMLEISSRSWKAEGGTDLVTQSGMADFFRSFARATAPERLWVVYLMRLEGRPAAFDFYVRHAGRLVGLRWEYDNELSYFMPGTVVHIAAIKDLLASGGREYDLAGTDTDFKSGLVDSVREHVDVTFGNNGLKSRILSGLKHALVRVQDHRR